MIPSRTQGIAEGARHLRRPFRCCFDMEIWHEATAKMIRSDKLWHHVVYPVFRVMR